MSQADLLRATIALLDAADIPHMVVGSFASSFHGEPRMTRDIDLVVEPSEQGITLLLDLVDRDRFYMGDAMDAFRNRSMFNLIEPNTGWKVDFVIRRDRPFSVAEFTRRFPARVAGVDVYMSTAEDTMLAKLEWAKASGSDRQIDDAVAIAVTQQVDRNYLTKWAHELDVVDLLGSVLKRADSAKTAEG